MKTNDIRAKFLQYFKDKDHRIIEPSPLPVDDPTLLFTVAGMVPLKQYYLGESTPLSLRMTSSQPCLRTNDIDNVGVTPRHHTFFEMLGNFSIGDYFKNQAIEYGWDFITNHLKIDSSKIWVTVYPEDVESKRIWSQFLPNTRIIDSSDNFWQMADVGPSGFDSEIFVDLGESVGCGSEECNPLCECGRFLEVWNLVFMEFNLEKDGTKTPLPRKNIDTGMGLERISCVVNNVTNNFDTDLFIPIIRSIEEKVGFSRDTNRVRFNIIADHVRAISFMIADGVFPENSKHGYVLRRLIRRAKLSGHLLGIKDLFLPSLCDIVIQDMGKHYTHLETNKEKIEMVVSNEEQQFSNTLEDGYSMFQDALKNVSKVFPGDVAFKLHDTYGFPIELTKELVREHKLAINEEQFHTLLKEQKKRAKTVHSFSNTIKETDFWVQLKNQVGKTHFLGYERDATSASVLSIIYDGTEVENATEENGNYLIVVNQTPLYPEKGGPVGDQGEIRSNNGQMKIERTFSPVHDIIVHEARLIKGSISQEDTVQVTVDIDFRRGIRRSHTATHLLHAALKKVVGEHVNQAGSFVEPDSLRFDFNAFEPLTEDQLFQVEDYVNDWIARSEYVKTDVKTLQQAMQDGATALFKEKYQDTVRVVKICDISKELCGGLHVSNTSELRVFGIVKESSVGSNLRRIEATVGNKAIERFRNYGKQIAEAKKHLDKPGLDIISAIDAIEGEVKSKEKEIKELQSQLLMCMTDDVLANAEIIGSVHYICKAVQKADMNLLRSFADQLRKKSQKPLVMFIYSKNGTKTIGVVASSGEVNCRELLKQLQKEYSIRGGGNPKLVSLGDIQSDSLQAVSNSIKDILDKNEA